jgi:spore coat assembly protein SafA
MHEEPKHRLAEHLRSSSALEQTGGDQAANTQRFQATGNIPEVGQDFHDQPQHSAADQAFQKTGGEHRVKKGDTLWAIAKRNHVSLGSLIAANPQIRNPNLIFPGQIVHIPHGARRPVPHQPGDGNEVDAGDGGKVDVGDATSGDDCLHLGDHGPEVAELQQLLKGAGYYHAMCGGNFGPQTDAALRRFQREHNLAEDGRASAETIAALHAAPVVAQPQQQAPQGDEGEATGGAAACAYGQSVLGAPYMALNPYRFGEVPWKGGGAVDIHGKYRGPYAAGTQLFDCSGFVVACWKHAGVNLLAHNLGSSSQMCDDTSFLQTISAGSLRPGDIIAWHGHVGMYYGNGQVIESTPNGGVKISDAGKFLNHAGAKCKRVPG